MRVVCFHRILRVACLVSSVCLLSCSNPAEKIGELAENGTGPGSEYRQYIANMPRRDVERLLLDILGRPILRSRAAYESLALLSKEQFSEVADCLAERKDRLSDKRLRVCQFATDRVAMMTCAERVDTNRAAAEGSQHVSLGFTAETYPDVDGSTSTIPLSRVIACRQLDVPYDWVTKRWRGPTAEEVCLREHYGTPEWRVADFTAKAVTPANRTGRIGNLINEVLAMHAGTEEAYRNLIEGKVDLLLVARGPTEDDLLLARKNGMELDAVPIALDALVVLVHTANRVRDLASDQVRRIYGGDIRNWNQVGGVDQEIRRFRRHDGSASQFLMDSLVMKCVPVSADGGYREGDDIEMAVDFYKGGALDNMVGTPGGIAYASHFYKSLMMSHGHIRALAIDGVMPSRETIQSQAYPYTTGVYAVMRDESSVDHGAHRLRDWLLSPVGQAVVGESGYIPIGETAE